MVTLANRVKHTITAVASSGTGTLTLGAASTGFQTLADASVATGSTVRYTIEGPSNAWELGSGVYTSSGTTLTRTPSESSNSGNAITATTDSTVFITASAADLGPVVYATINDLTAATGMVVGDIAMVNATKKLYMYTATGWWLIATLTNASPAAITGANATYSLAGDGTATVVTLAATDPEGFPITFSHTVTSGSLGSTATVSQNNNVFTITPSTNSAHEGSFSLTFSASDGNSVSQAVSAFTLSFGFDLSSASYDNKSYSTSSVALNPVDIKMKSDGTKLYVASSTTTNIHQFSLSTAHDISTASSDSVSFNPSTQLYSEAPYGILFNSNGSRMYVSGKGPASNQSSIWQYNLSSAYDLSTASHYNNGTPTSGTTQAGQLTHNKGSWGSMAWNADGTKLFFISNSDNKVYEFPLSTAYDISTASNATSSEVTPSASFDCSTQEDDATGIAFNTNGTKMFIVGWDGDAVFQYNLSTAFSVSSASYSSVSFGISSQISHCNNVIFNTNGSKMYLSGQVQDKVFQYSTSA